MAPSKTEASSEVRGCWSLTLTCSSVDDRLSDVVSKADYGMGIAAAWSAGATVQP